MQYMACICGPLHYSAVPVHAPRPEVPLKSTLCTAAPFQFKQQEPCRAVSLSVGEGLLAFTTDAFMGTQSMIHIAKLEQDIEQQSSKSILSIEAPKGRITRVFWSELNRALVTSHDGGFLRKWDSEVMGEEGREGRAASGGSLHSLIGMGHTSQPMNPAPFQCQYGVPLIL